VLEGPRIAAVYQRELVARIDLNVLVQNTDSGGAIV
jgi:hypothetical protein